MKKIFLSSIVLLFAVSTFASIKPVNTMKKKPVPTAFRFIGSVGQENDPTKYVVVTLSNLTTTFCPTGTTKICGLYIVNDATLIYTQTEADVSSTDRITDDWVGKPKVDAAAGTTLDDDIATALSVPENSNHTYAGTNVTIYKKN